MEPMTLLKMLELYGAVQNVKEGGEAVGVPATQGQLQGKGGAAPMGDDPALGKEGKKNSKPAFSFKPLDYGAMHSMSALEGYEKAEVDKTGIDSLMGMSMKFGAQPETNRQAVAPTNNPYIASLLGL